MSIGDNIGRAYAFAQEINLNSGIPKVDPISRPLTPSLQEQEIAIEKIFKYNLKCEEVRRAILKLIYDGDITQFRIDYNSGNQHPSYIFIIYNLQIHFQCPVERNRARYGYEPLDEKHFVDLIKYLTSLLGTDSVKQISQLLKNKSITGVSISVGRTGNMSIMCRLPDLVQFQVDTFEKLLEKINRFQQLEVSIKPEYEFGPSMSTSIPSSSSVISFSILAPPYPPSNIHLRLGENVGIYEIVNFDSKIHHIDGKWIYNSVPLECVKLFTADPTDQKAWLTFLFRFKVSQDPAKHYLFVIDKAEETLENLYDSFILS